MSAKLETLSQNLQKHFGDKLKTLKLALGELTIEVAAADYLAVMTSLRDEPDLMVSAKRTFPRRDPAHD